MTLPAKFALFQDVHSTNKQTAAHLHINTQLWSTVCTKSIGLFFFFFLLLNVVTLFLLGGGWPQFYNSQSSPFPWLSLFFPTFSSSTRPCIIGGRPSTFTFVLVLLNKRKNEKIKRGKELERGAWFTPVKEEKKRTNRSGGQEVTNQ